jgi:uncharacterized protein YegL
MGGVAALPGLNLITASSAAVENDLGMLSDGLVWYDPATGQKRAREVTCQPSFLEPFQKQPVVPRAFADNEFFPMRLRPPDPLGDVETICIPLVPTETSTPVPTTTDTATPTASVTLVESATPTAPPPTPSPTRTPSPPPRPIYLPLVLREEACVVARRAAVALVVDTSSSMLDLTGSGRTKLDAAVEAAGGLVDALRFPEDQAAVIGFDADVVVEELTSDRQALLTALAVLRSETGTNIAAGVVAAHDELVSHRRRPDNFPVMVVLTDGKANDGPQPAIEAAREAKDDGIAVLTIGLGADVDREQLVAMASKPAWYYETADAEDLDQVYAEIAVNLPCPPEMYWGRR